MNGLRLGALMIILVQLSAARQEPVVVQGSPELAVISFSWSRFLRNPNALVSPFPNAPTTIGARGGQRGPYGKRVEMATSKGFAYKMKLKNGAAKTIKALFWEYQFEEPTSSQDISRRQFMCLEKIKSGAIKELAVFSLSPPTRVVNAESLGDETKAEATTKVVINRIEYLDGTIWRRSDWSPPRTSAYPADLFPSLRHRNKCVGF